MHNWNRNWGRFLPSACLLDFILVNSAVQEARSHKAVWLYLAFPQCSFGFLLPSLKLHGSELWIFTQAPDWSSYSNIMDFNIFVLSTGDRHFHPWCTDPVCKISQFLPKTSVNPQTAAPSEATQSSLLWNKCKERTSLIFYCLSVSGAMIYLQLTFEIWSCRWDLKVIQAQL